ncbi:alpha/beta fold hydrolase [Streptomyces palmae]|uniref:Alpha/beta hydrolase n=1 Tax=Streptomyces palmae TaxID=1701085 RepID=A0A4Z0HDD8_9ACTN|nr:alpha/beta hydrolase [Streptomyces palmae]TGB10700.1 alpha/beta hydrolase [Streptomyces palmae]
MPFATPEFEAEWSPLLRRTIDGYHVEVMHHPPHSDAPVLLMAHGLEEGWQVWLPMARLLMPEFRLLLVDFPWRAHNDYGWSETLPPSEWMGEVVRNLPIVPDAIVGHSFGSNATLEFLAKPNAPLIKAAVLTSPFYRSEPSAITWDLFHEGVANFREILSAGLRVRSGDKRIDPEIFERMVDRLLERVGPTGFANLFRLFSHAPGIRTDRIISPTLIIGGVTDETSTPTGIRELAGALVDGRVELLPEYDHFCQVEQAEEIAQLTAAHLREHLFMPHQALLGMGRAAA